MSFYYLFIPTWFFTILVYTFLAGRYGAKQRYPDAEEREQAFNATVERYHQELAKEELQTAKDNSMFSKALKTLAYTALAVTLFLAFKVLFASPSEEIYISNRAAFYQIGFACTLIYFIAAYWAMQRGKSLNSK